MISGNYTIVSTYRPDRPVLSIDAVRLAWNRGLSVALVIGVWQGNVEESLLLTGRGHHIVGQKIARQYSQDAYITVSEGKAILYVKIGNFYVTETVYTRELERTVEDSYTIAPDGKKFVFAA